MTTARIAREAGIPRTLAPAALAGRDAYAFAFWGAIGLGIVLRAAPALTADFPLTDGGLFFLMVEAVRAAHYALPATVLYNGTELPFAYPPLGFYLAAILADATRISTLDLLRLIPLAASLLALLAFAGAASRVLRSRLAAVIAVGIFAIAPGGYVSLLMGGGLTRGLGFLLMVLALDRGYAMYVERRRAPVALCGLCCGLTMLSHPSMALFAALSMALLFLAFGRSRDGIVRTIAAAACTLVVVAPWAIAALSQQGAGAFFAAFQKGSLVVGSTVGDGPSLEGLVALGLFGLGVVACLAMAATGRRGLFMVGWLGLMVLVVPRELTRVSIVPLALAGGEVGAAIMAGIRSRPRPPFKLRSVLGWGAVAVVALAIWPVIWSVMTDRDGFVALSAAERRPMQWAQAQTPASSRFLIISGRSWPRDRVSEWFPVLSDRVSVVTPQGTEWTTDGRFGRLGAASAQAQVCAGEDAACIDAWERETSIPFDYVYLATDPTRDCCPSLGASLSSAPGYRSVYQDGAAAIFQRSAP